MIRRSMKRSLPPGIPGGNTHKKAQSLKKNGDIKYCFEKFHESYKSLPQAQVKNLRCKVGIKKKNSKVKCKTNILKAQFKNCQYDVL